MLFSRNIQLAVTWRIISEISLYHREEFDHIEQNLGDSSSYQVALFGFSDIYLGFNVATQTIDPAHGARETGLEALEGNYVEAFLSGNPSDVVLSLESLGNLNRNEYGACGLTESTLPISLIADLLQAKMFTQTRLEVSNAFCHSSEESENSTVREWARLDKSIPAWAFDPDDDQWDDKMRVAQHLWKLAPGKDLNVLESPGSPGIIFDFRTCSAFLKGSAAEPLLLWDIYRNIGYADCLKLLEVCLAQELGSSR